MDRRGVALHTTNTTRLNKETVGLRYCLLMIMISFVVAALNFTGHLSERKESF